MPKVDLANLLAGVGRGIGSVAEAHMETSKMKIQQNKVDQAKTILSNPESTPIQKAMALANMGQEKLGLEVFKSAAKRDTTGGIDQELNMQLNSIRNGGNKNAPNIPAATTNVGETEPAIPFSVDAPNRTASNAISNGITPQMMQGVDQNYNPYGQNNQQPQNVTQSNTSTQPAPVEEPQAPVVNVSPEEQEIDTLKREADAYDQAANKYAEINPTLSRNHKETATNKRKEAIKIQDRIEHRFDSNRKYANQTNKSFHEDIEATSKKLPQAKMLLDMAQQAVDSGEVGPLSRANLAKRLNIKELNSAPGAALDAAVKGALINNVSKLSAKGLNMFMEKVALSAYAQVGESMENNQLKLEAARAELELAEAEIKAYDMQLEEDLREHGAEQPFLKRRADKFLVPQQKEIADRASFKMKRIKERADGYAKLDRKWNKQVTQGTPLTPEMGRILLNKTGSPEKMIDVAKKLGYTILSAEQIKSYE